MKGLLVESTDKSSSGIKYLLELETYNNSAGKIRNSGQNELFSTSISEYVPVSNV